MVQINKIIIVKWGQKYIVQYCNTMYKRLITTVIQKQFETIYDEENWIKWYNKIYISHKTADISSV